MAKMQDMLKRMVVENASDIHLVSGAPPLFRVAGELVSFEEEKLSSEDCRKLCYSVMTEEQRGLFEERKELDFSFALAQLGRFRANVYLQRGAASLALRLIPHEIQSLEDLKLPSILGDLTERPSGLILVTGATGSGKSTTLAAMLDKINRTKTGHILTIEDPIEFVHAHKKCLISQRELNSDTPSFASALKTALRQDPDFVLIGELRDPETMETALTIAETGHLTFGTLHTNSAVQTISRMLDAFPADKQDQIKTQLSFVLQSVVSQTLLPKIGGGRVLASEILVGTPAIRAMIRDGKLHQVQGMIETGKKFGMHTLNSSLADLVNRGLVTQKNALERSTDKEGLGRLLSGSVY